MKRSLEAERRHHARKKLKRKLEGRKPTVRCVPNVVDCLHNGALSFGGTCFATDKTKVHVECWRAHFNMIRKDLQ